MYRNKVYIYVDKYLMVFHQINAKLGAAIMKQKKKDFSLLVSDLFPKGEDRK